MYFSSFNKLMIAGAMFVSMGAGLALASADDQINARQEQMKTYGKAIGALAKIYKGEEPYSDAAVKAELGKMDTAAKAAQDAKAWDASSQEGGTVKSYAKPELFKDKAGVEAAYKKYVEAKTALDATKDEAGFKAAFPALGESCKGCHEKYRLPKE